MAKPDPRRIVILDTSKPLENKILKDILSINQEHVPMVGALKNIKDLENLLKMSFLSAVTYNEGRITSFIVCLRENKEYKSLNYVYFSEMYKKFFYVDRIGVKKEHQNIGLGSLLYKKIDEINNKLKLPICAEVNTKPYNKTSIQFHIKHGFKKIGEKSFSNEHEVAYFIKKGQIS
mgnify:CR=1 FL=1|tara:strand:+ start:110 stop:637 length:528 start_codon:yes stop_codon:yes gene_type:complete